MKVLYLSRGDIFDGTSSITNIPMAKFKAMLDEDPDLSIDWTLSQRVGDDAWRSTVEGYDRIRPLRILGNQRLRMLGYLSNPDTYAAVMDPSYDVILNTHFPLTPFYREIAKAPIVTWQMWSATFPEAEASPYFFYGDEDVMAECLSSLVSDWNVWESNYTLESHLRTLQTWCRPESVDWIRTRSSVIYHGIPLRRFTGPLADRMARAKKGSGPVIFWGGRVAYQKRPAVTFPLMERVRDRTAVAVVVSTSDKSPAPMTEYPAWDWHLGVNSDGYARLTAAGDVFICNSATESYGVAWLEMLAAGMLGVFHEEAWSRALLPDWYPYITRSESEQVLMATALLQSWPDGSAWRTTAPRVREWLMEEHDDRRNALRLLEVLYERKR